MILDEALRFQKGGVEVYFFLYFIVVAQIFTDILFFEERAVKGKLRWLSVIGFKNPTTRKQQLSQNVGPSKTIRNEHLEHE